jgi:ketosteroid isomerase-like protein
MEPVLVLLMLAISATAQMTESGLLKLDDDFAKTTSEKRLDGWVSFMMNSTVVFGPQHSAQRIVGREEIRDYYRDMFAMPDFKMSWTPRTAQLLPSGQTGYTRGTFHWVSPNYKCRCVNDWHGTYLAVWEEEQCPGGAWKLKALFPSPEEGSGSCGCGS